MGKPKTEFGIKQNQAHLSGANMSGSHYFSLGEAEIEHSLLNLSRQSEA